MSGEQGRWSELDSSDQLDPRDATLDFSGLIDRMQDQLRATSGNGRHAGAGGVSDNDVTAHQDLAPAPAPTPVAPAVNGVSGAGHHAKPAEFRTTPEVNGHSRHAAPVVREPIPEPIAGPSPQPRLQPGAHTTSPAAPAAPLPAPSQPEVPQREVPQPEVPQPEARQPAPPPPAFVAYARPGEKPVPGSLADLRQRLERLPWGHPSSPYHVDGERKPPPPRLKHLELAPPAPNRFAAAASLGSASWSSPPVAVTASPDVAGFDRSDPSGAPLREADSSALKLDEPEPDEPELTEPELTDEQEPGLEVESVRAVETVPEVESGPKAESVPETEPTRPAEPAPRYPEIRYSESALYSGTLPEVNPGAAGPSDVTRPVTATTEISDATSEFASPQLNGQPVHRQLDQNRPDRSEPSHDEHSRSQPSYSRTSYSQSDYRPSSTGHASTAPASTAPASTAPASTAPASIAPIRPNVPVGPEAPTPRMDFDGSWSWGPARLSADQVRVANDAYDRFRVAEGRNLFGSYGSVGLTTTMRRIADQLQHGDLAPDTDQSALLDPDTFRVRFADMLRRYPDRTADRLARRIPGAISYSFIFDAEHYSAGIWTVQDALSTARFQLLARRNDWNSAVNRCVATMWHDPANDLPFQVQFHTPASLDAQQRARSSAALINDPRIPSAQAAHLQSDLAATWASIPAPPGNAQISDYRR
jgi:hypothetical protein